MATGEGSFGLGGFRRENDRNQDRCWCRDNNRQRRGLLRWAISKNDRSNTKIWLVIGQSSGYNLTILADRVCVPDLTDWIDWQPGHSGGDTLRPALNEVNVHQSTKAQQPPVKAALGNQSGSSES